jgi:Mce-associated membrane protein
MAEAKKPPQDPATSKADAMALLEEAEAEAAEAEALAAAARARARAARLRREAQAQAEKEAESTAAEEAPDAEEAADTAETKTDEADTETDDVTDTAEAKTDDEEAETEEEVSDETHEHAESEPEGTPARARRRVRLPSWSVAWKAAVVLLICAFVAASGYMMWNRHEVTERNQRAANFVAGARQGVVNMTSLDFNRAKEDVQRVIDSTTGQFRDDFAQRAKDFTTVVEQSKVVTQGTVNAAALQSIDGNSALVLVAATSRITNAAGAKDEPRSWRLKVTVTDDGGQYKMSKMEFVP